jgi:hypothetical protein
MIIPGTVWAYLIIFFSLRSITTLAYPGVRFISPVLNRDIASGFHTWRSLLSDYVLTIQQKAYNMTGELTLYGQKLFWTKFDCRIIDIYGRIVLAE